MKRTLVAALAKMDEAIDEVLYRPAVVKAFAWLPRWWQCDLAKISIWLDDRWHTHYWNDAGRPGPPCAICGRRASWLEVEGISPGHTIEKCGWCVLPNQIQTADDLERAFESARRASMAWRWRAPRSQ